MDIEPGKGMTMNESNEHQRKWNDHTKQVQMGRREYDPTRDHLNFEIAKGGKIQPIDKSKSIPQRMKERLEALGLKDPNEGRRSLPETRWLRLSFKVIMTVWWSWRLALRMWIWNVKGTTRISSGCRRLNSGRSTNTALHVSNGEDNIVGFYVHLDEKCPHIHCTVLPITDKVKLSHKKVFHGESKEAMRAYLLYLHDELAKVNAKWGLERGSDIRETGAKHCSPEQYRRKLAQELDELKRKIDDGEMTLDEIRKQTAAAERKLKSFTTMIANLTTRQEELTRQRDELLREYNQADADKSRLDSELAKTEKELEKVREKLTNRQLQLSVTEQELDVLHQQVVKAETQVQEMDAELGRMSGDYTKQVELRLKSVAMDEMVSTVHDMLTTSPYPEVQQALDKTLAKEFAMRFSGIIGCAILLSVGLVDQATTFAEGHGGGGGGSDMPWGRREDEDERKWLMRCLMQGARMMHPRVGQKKKR